MRGAAASLPELALAVERLSRLLIRDGEHARRPPPQPFPPGTAAFTPAERQVVGLVVSGMTNREIAGRLFLSEKTIEAHLSRVYRKAGVRSRTQLAALLAGPPR